MAPWTHWTSTEAQTLRCCYEEGMPLKDIAKWIGRPVHNIYGKAYRMGLTAGRPSRGIKWPEEDKRILIEGARNNWSTEEIISKLSIPRTKKQIVSQLQNLRRRGYDIPKRSRKGKVFSRGG